MEKQIKYNPTFSDFFTTRKRYAILKGGAGSSKSYSTGQKILHRILTEKGHRIWVIRKVADTLRKSVFQLFVDLIVEYDLYDRFTINKSEMRFTCRENGNEVLLTGLDDPEKIKSIQGITGVWVEEATELAEEDFYQVELRIRGEKPNYVQYILTFNPIDEQSWIKRRFFDMEDPDVYVMNSTYKDNLFLDADYIRHLETRLKHNENLYRIYVLGEWGNINTGNEFYHTFRHSAHVTDTELYDPTLPLYLSFDENVNPYLSCLIAQVKGTQIRIIDEIAAEHPQNTVSGICTEFRNRYFSHLSGVLITGDATSQKQDVKLEKGYNFYKLIERELDRYRPRRILPPSNPSVYMRGLFINSVLASNFGQIQVVVSSGAEKYIRDMLYTKQAPDGTKHKEVEKDSNGIRSQKFGHLSDCFDYLICEVFKREYADFQTGGTKAKPVIGVKTYNKSTRY